jgi:thiol:disulfide interchange protein
MYVKVLAGVCAAAMLVGFDYSAAYGQSGRNRNTRPAQQQAADPVPTMSNDDVVAPAAVPADDFPPAGSIEWQTSFDTAKNAAADGQVIFVDVYTDWCGWCKFMDQRVYTDPGVRRFASKHVFVRINAEDRGAGTAFARRSRVQGFPTLLVFSKDGKLIGQQVGAFRKAGDFLAWIQQTARQR